MLHDCRMAYLPFADEAAGVGMDLEVSLERALRAGAELRFGPVDAGDWRVAEPTLGCCWPSRPSSAEHGLGSTECLLYTSDAAGE
ncbi:hypothetical protein A7X99_15515 [Stenotrophomonas maltophilia]|nr:hypothetical protein A7X99_15515 [Stenotrophomonas maltophilia]